MELKCPNCGFVLHPKPEWAGKRGKCKNCGGRILIPCSAVPQPKTPLVTPSASSPSASDQDEEILLTLADPDDLPVSAVSIADAEDAILLTLADPELEPSPRTSPLLESPFDFSRTNSERSEVKSRLVRTTRSEGSNLLLKGLAFFLSAPIGIIAGVLIRRVLFPEADGAMSSGAAVGCCYVAYQTLKSIFGVKE